MGHYEKRNVKLRCDGDHEWGEPYLDSSSTEIVLHSGQLCLKLQWSIVKQCQNDHTNTVKTVHNKCKAMSTVDRGSKLVPVSDLPER